MISPRKNQWLIVSVLMLLAAAAWASEPNETPIVLEFEISPTPLGPYSVSHLPFGHANESGGRSFAAAKPTYAADIVITGPTRFLPFPRRGAWNFFLREFAMQRAGPVRRAKGAAAHCPGVFRALSFLPERPH